MRTHMCCATVLWFMSIKNLTAHKFSNLVNPDLQKLRNLVIMAGTDPTRLKIDCEVDVVYPKFCDVWLCRQEDGLLTILPPKLELGSGFEHSPSTRRIPANLFPDFRPNGDLTDVVTCGSVISVIFRTPDLKPLEVDTILRKAEDTTVHTYGRITSTNSKNGYGEVKCRAFAPNALRFEPHSVVGEFEGQGIAALTVGQTVKLKVGFSPREIFSVQTTEREITHVFVHELLEGFCILMEPKKLRFVFASYTCAAGCAAVHTKAVAAEKKMNCKLIRAMINKAEPGLRREWEAYWFDLSP